MTKKILFSGIVQVSLIALILMWDPSRGASHYEVRFDGGKWILTSATRIEIPPGTLKVEVRACHGTQCSESSTMELKKKKKGVR